LEWLKSGDAGLNKQELLLTPLLAYWLPAAMRHFFQKPEREVKRSAQYALYLVEVQRARLIYEFGAEPMPEPPHPSGTASPDGQAIAREGADGGAAQPQADGAARSRAREANGADGADRDRARREAERFAQEPGNDDWVKNVFGD